jgi:predicted flavoprotein YhiN
VQNPSHSNTVAVLGGGAAGFFGAIACAEANPRLTVYLIEKTSKLLSKVRISGGGRCNVTHACESPTQLAQHYRAGASSLKRLSGSSMPAPLLPGLKSAV